MAKKLKIHTVYLDTEKAKIAMGKVGKEQEGSSLSWLVRYFIDKYITGKLKIK